MKNVNFNIEGWTEEEIDRVYHPIPTDGLAGLHYPDILGLSPGSRDQ